MNNDILINEQKMVATDIEGDIVRINEELDKYINKTDHSDYAIAIASGLLAGVVDSIFVGSTFNKKRSIGASHKQVNQFIQSYANIRGIKSDGLKNTIARLEDTFKVAQDDIWKGKDIGISAKNHHLADLAHHPTPLGLLASMAVQFLRVGVFVNKKGEWHFVPVETKKEDVGEILVPAVLTGFLNWVAAMAEKKAEDEGEEIPEGMRKLIKLVASTPMLIQVIKCADNWFGHLVSDMGGSKNTPGHGMGIPGVFISLMYEIAALPGLKDSGLPAIIDDMYVKQHIDLRKEINIYKSIGRQTIPVILYEVFIRAGFLLRRLAAEAELHENRTEIEWKNVIPIKNRTVDRMITVAAMTFTCADATDAAIRAAIDSGGNWVLFAGHFVSRFNYVGAGKAALSIIKEVSDESREAELLHEKRLLVEKKTDNVIEQIQEYKRQLEKLISDYMVEDLKLFILSADMIEGGIANEDSDTVIEGSILITERLGYKSQFTDSEEFDELMDSDDTFTL